MKFARVNFAEQPVEARQIRALLALIIVMAVLSLLRQLDLSEELQELQTKVGSQPSAASTKKPSEKPSANLQVKTPDWTRLFDALEGSATPHITLVSIKPDASKKRLSLTGKAIEPQSIANYVDALSQDGTLRNIRIQNIRKTENSANPYAFNLDMDWGDGS